MARDISTAIILQLKANYGIIIKDEEATLSNYRRGGGIVAGVIVCSRSCDKSVSGIKLFWICFDTAMGNYFGFGNCFGTAQLLPHRYSLLSLLSPPS